MPGGFRSGLLFRTGRCCVVDGLRWIALAVEQNKAKSQHADHGQQNPLHREHRIRESRVRRQQPVKLGKVLAEIAAAVTASTARTRVRGGVEQPRAYDLYLDVRTFDAVDVGFGAWLLTEEDNIRAFDFDSGRCDPFELVRARQEPG